MNFFLLLLLLLPLSTSEKRCSPRQRDGRDCSTPPVYFSNHYVIVTNKDTPDKDSAIIS